MPCVFSQEDNLEKSQQICLMSAICSSASRVVVYLGENVEIHALAIRLIEAIAETEFSIHSYELDYITYMPTFGLRSNNGDPWKAFRSFWCRPCRMPMEMTRETSCREWGW